MVKKNYFKNVRHHQQRERKLVERIMQYISNNLSKNVSASLVSNQFEMSTTSLEHLFKEYRGQTYHQYVSEIRMMTAFDLITKDGLRIQQTMFATGYHYRSSFNKAFKKRFKHSPGYFRNMPEQ